MNKEKNRIELKFETLKIKDEKALIPFITAGDPDLRTTMDLALEMENAGADIIELGIPYSDPIADGPVIQASSARALENGTKIKNIMETVKKIRKKSNIPLVYLVYYNSIFKYGITNFMEESRDAGVDGVIVPDLPLEERKELYEITQKSGIALIPLVAPASRERIKSITEKGEGFVYCVSSNGVTGARTKLPDNVKAYLDTVSEFTEMPRALGFGISGPEMAKEYKDYCDAIIIGSALIQKIAESSSHAEAVKNAACFISEVKEALK